MRLAHLATSLEGLAIPESPDRSRIGERRDWIVRTVNGYLIPRIEDPIAPLTVVFAGPTGAGKSTLLNSVAGAPHSLAGPLRPTTKWPLVLASRERAARYATIAGVECQVVTGRAPILDELTLVDTPDIDSTSAEHRAIAETMIDNADIVVYVNSAQRYGDLVPWEVLRRAHSRGAPVIHVLNRIKSSSGGALSSYTARLEAEGLGSEVVAVHEHHMPRGKQSVPLTVIQSLRERLVDIVEERLAGRADVVMSVLDTTLEQADEMLSELAGLTEQAFDSTSPAGLAPDPDRIAARATVRGDDLPSMAGIAALGGKRLFTTWRVRNRLPLPSAVARSHRFLDASLVTAIDADIRETLSAVTALDRSGVDEIGFQAHPAAVAAVTAWHTDIADMQFTRAAIDPGLAAYLLARRLIEPGEELGSEVLQILAALDDLSGPTIRAGELLQQRLEPVYDRVGAMLAGRVRSFAVSDAAIYRARTSLTAVAARSAFANA